jgi:O-acetyl-ADP-ribose deacetylase (regulator of RNase III)
MIVKANESTLELVVGDITKQDTEAVVNAANKRLAPGGGVAGAMSVIDSAVLRPTCQLKARRAEEGVGEAPTSETTCSVASSRHTRWVGGCDFSRFWPCRTSLLESS